jgi:dTDP-4-amino-4,6-dideoxygalactose transaminase
MGGSEQQFVQEAFDSNWVAPLGPNVSGFEQDLENYIGEATYVAALSSGTAALHLGLILLGVQHADEVICQSFTFSASANPIRYQGAVPVFVDSEPDTWNMSPQALEEAIKDRISKGTKPKAIIAVHLYGMPFKADEIRAVADKYEIPILEDSAEALGSTYKGRRCGTFGDIGVLSFNGNKIITTSGGGALVANTKEIKEKAVFLATQARDNAPHYQHSEVGFNYRLSNICAGIGRGQMQVLEKHVELRRKMHAFYVDLFSKFDGITVFDEPSPDFRSNHWLSAITVDSKVVGKTREQFRIALEAENIETRPLWKPMHLQPVFECFSYYGSNVSETLFDNGLCLPSGSNLTDEETERIKDAVNRFFK